MFDLLCHDPFIILDLKKLKSLYSLNNDSTVISILWRELCPGTQPSAFIFPMDSSMNFTSPFQPAHGTLRLRTCTSHHYNPSFG